MVIQEKIKLAPYTTFKIGGEARFFGIVKNIEDLKEGVGFAKQNLLPIFILGGGSNLLISDDGFNGLVLKIEINHLAIGLPSDGEVEVLVGAGVILDNLIDRVVKKNLSGLENLSWIPGTIGGGIVQNCGAYGTEIKDLISWVEVFDIKTGKVKKLEKKECEFKYRNSIFKQKINWIIIRVALNLKKKVASSATRRGGGKGEINLTSQNIRDTIIETRKKTTPRLDNLGSAGCFFKNIVISKEKFKKIKERFPEVPNFEEGDKIKIPSAWFIDEFGWKGYLDGEVGVYDKHALMLVNKKDGTCEDIKNLAKKIENDVYKKTGLKLEKEVVVINF